jgi:hypothetical protein
MAKDPTEDVLLPKGSTKIGLREISHFCHAVFISFKVF